MTATICFSDGTVKPRSSRVVLSWMCALFAVWIATTCQVSGAEIAPGVFRTGLLQHQALLESSGLTSSPNRPGVFWTHNDTIAPAFLFAMDETGRHLGAYEVQGISLIDWEAITSDQGFLYIADTGTNGIARTHVAIHQVREPNLDQTWGRAEVMRSWLLRFPGEREDCESFFIANNYGYLIGKYPLNGQVSMYRFSLSDSSVSILLEKVTDISISAPVSDAAISADKNRLGLVSEDGVTIIFIGGDPALAGSALRRSIQFPNESIEGGTFTDDGFLTTAEGIPDIFLFQDGPVDLRITEVMSSENSNPGPTADWWELTSFETEVVDLSVWRFNDSLGDRSDGYVLPVGTNIRPGESIIFVEDLTAGEFLTWWGTANIAPNTQIIPYAGAALSFRATGESLRLWNNNDQPEVLLARVDFGAATQGLTFIYDPETQLFGSKSEVGVHGAFAAAWGDDIGSPGRIREPASRLSIAVDAAGLTISVRGNDDGLYALEESSDLAAWHQAGEQTLTNASWKVPVGGSGDRALFYRVRKR